MTLGTALLALALVAPLGLADVRLANAQLPSPRRDSTVSRSDSLRPATRLRPVTVVAGGVVHGMGFLPDLHGMQLLAGKKTEVVLLDSLGANVALDVARQILGRVPGMNVSETAMAGFPANGIGVRGLDPVQSVEMNVRQDGVSIAADPFGYPEIYYAPPSEAVERIEFVRGASSLQFGPQFGGLVNYVLRRGDVGIPLRARVAQTFGSWGLSNTYLSAGGTAGDWRYFGYVQRRATDGWRENNTVDQVSGHLSAEWHARASLTARVDVSVLDNRLRMPGGLSDAAFAQDARQSLRPRNWIATPWRLASASLEWRPTRDVTISSVTSWQDAERSLVWRNESVGPAVRDSVDPGTGSFDSREVGREFFRGVTEDVRALVQHEWFGAQATLATGVRVFGGTMRRQGDGAGSTSSDFDLSLKSGTFGYDLRFGTRNLALFAEDAIRVTDRLTITPGARLEWIGSTVGGYSDTAFSPQSKLRHFTVVGVGATYASSPSTAVYANVTQAYRPALYATLTPIASVSRVDPQLRDATGWSADVGWRGTVGDRMRFDVGAFWLAYNDRPGLVTRAVFGGGTYTERTNVSNSVHRGLESYLEVAMLDDATPTGLGSLAVFNSLALMDARYVSGAFEGKTVEYAPPVIERAGIRWARASLSSTAQVSYTARSFGDANNSVVASADAVTGPIPSYTVVDWSGAWRLGRGWEARLNVNNVFDARYFTRRADEYPGPGILPALGRGVSFTLAAQF